jgi:hypothetical protein
MLAISLVQRAKKKYLGSCRAVTARLRGTSSSSLYKELFREGERSRAWKVVLLVIVVRILALSLFSHRHA